jgi:hypothetical protein
MKTHLSGANLWAFPKNGPGSLRFRRSPWEQDNTSQG